MDMRYPNSKISATLIFSCVCLSAQADQFYLIASLNCNTPKSELVVSFRGFWNEAGEAAIASQSSEEFDPRKLVAFHRDSSGKYSIRTETVNKSCLLDGKDYIVEFSPLMATGFHPEGFCAARIGAKAVILSNGVTVAMAGVDACAEEGMVTRTITLGMVFKTPCSPRWFEGPSRGTIAS
ncbi:MAG: hypothetical protein HYX45_05775 [Burkholderiales bacterium]|nr:hypothetical protein [Burkholderiales bacterium]